MKAILCNAFGPPESLVVGELPVPAPGPGQVLVDVAAAGVNFTDLLAIEGRSQLKRSFPFVPGIEVSGHIASVGEGVKGLAVGQPVVGHRVNGSFAQQAVFDADEVYPIPPEMDLAQSAAFSIASMTSRYALIERGAVKPGDRLLVIGAGSGAGLTAVQIGKVLGAHVVAAASSAEKVQLAIDHGADQGLIYPRETLDTVSQKQLYSDLVAASGPRAESGGSSIGILSSLGHGAGFDVIYDAVGGTYAEPALRSLAWQGRYLSVGFSAGVPAPSLGPLLFKNATIHGIQPTAEDDRRLGRNTRAMDQLLQWHSQGKLKPFITAVYPLARAAEALRSLKDRKALGRVVLSVNPALVGATV